MIVRVEAAFSYLRGDKKSTTGNDFRSRFKAENFSVFAKRSASCYFDCFKFIWVVFNKHSPMTITASNQRFFWYCNDFAVRFELKIDFHKHT